MSFSIDDLDTWATALVAGDRRALSRAITLAESRRSDHRAAARKLLEILQPRTGKALRLGLSGTPGVGKSTFIESFGEALIEKGERVAVLAVDPSSSRSGGSILGDKTRMERLSRNPKAYIRPSPAEAELGGVARRTREAILLLEAAGYSVVIVETVGVGQSETMVADMTDVFVLLLAPAGGDELQGVKRGVMERADLVLVNKADGPLEPVARSTVADYAAALHLLRRRAGDPDNIPAAAPVSAATGAGLSDAWDRIKALDEWRTEQGWRARRREDQAVRWLRTEIERGLMAEFDADNAIRAVLPDAREAVAAGRETPESAAERLLALFRSRNSV